MRDYSQHGEQAVILSWAGVQPQPGSFLDLGAYDGSSYSNTAALADLGWPGICVDAAPDAAAACALRYADRDDVAVILAAFAVGITPPTLTINWTPGAMYSALRASAHPDAVIVPIEVPVLDLEWCFAERVQRLPRPLFVSIDLEGESLNALKWLLTHTDPACICVEANNPTDQDAARALLGDWAEVMIRDNHVNLFFERVAVAA